MERTGVHVRTRDTLFARAVAHAGSLSTTSAVAVAMSNARVGLELH